MDNKQAIKILSKETSLEAVNALKYYAGFNQDKVVEQIEEAMNMGAAALKKQIPKKVGKRKLRKDEIGTPYYCPECEADINLVHFFRTDGSEPEEKVSYCWSCGQAIRWE